MTGNVYQRDVLTGFASLLIILFCFAGDAAGNNVLGLDERVYYDVHVVSYEDTGIFVIQNVEIVGLREINDLTFLVIQTDRFDSKRSEGLIRFDSIRAVLPTLKHFGLRSLAK